MWDPIQAELIPGLKELDEPDFYFSGVYMTWLYVTDKKSWTHYTALFAYIFECVYVSMLGIVIAFLSKIDFNASFTGWLLSMFITFLIAIRTATSKRWEK